MEIVFKKSEDKEKKKSSYVKKAFWSLIVIIVVKAIWPNFIPLNILHFWETKKSLYEWFTSAGWFFIWGIFLFIVIYLVKASQISYMDLRETSPKKILKAGVVISMRAGVIEEICFRWLIFLAGIVTIRISNWILGGFMGSEYGLPKWFYMHIIGPLANFMTAGYVHDIIFHPNGWFIGAALISANSLFRDGHSYQGIIGWIDSWFFGMLMFFILFKYGLIACIILHFSFDMMLFILVAITTIIHKKSYGI